MNPTTPSIGIGILSWRAHETIRKSLQSYAENGFLSMFDEKIIFFSDISEQDIALAEEYGWDYAGGPNQGIAGGMKHLAEHMRSEYILLLQNDNPIIEPKDFAIDHIRQAVAMMQRNEIDIARMRHRWRVGEGFADAFKYLDLYPARDLSPEFLPAEHGIDTPDTRDSIAKKLKRLLRPSKARNFRGRSIFVERHPDRVHPDVIRAQGDFLLTDSSVLHFSDQCLLIRRDLWLDTLMPYVENNPSSRRPNGFQAPETCINGRWWRKKRYRIAQGRGVFGHARFDGSFRPEHPTNRSS